MPASVFGLGCRCGGLAGAARPVGCPGVLARSEGVYAEPTGASPIAALPCLLADGDVPPGSRIVCMMTGHGSKDGKLSREMPVRTHKVEIPPTSPQSPGFARLP